KQRFSNTARLCRKRDADVAQAVSLLSRDSSRLFIGGGERTPVLTVSFRNNRCSAQRNKDLVIQPSGCGVRNENVSTELSMSAGVHTRNVENGCDVFRATAHSSADRGHPRPDVMPISRVFRRRRSASSPYALQTCPPTRQSSSTAGIRRPPTQVFSEQPRACKRTFSEPCGALRLRAKQADS